MMGLKRIAAVGVAIFALPSGITAILTIMHQGPPTFFPVLGVWVIFLAMVSLIIWAINVLLFKWQL
jgi:hypothetical protein